jgi:4-amino-4-deoxy-L-arabinose transferase-like glycosyltransferase
MDRTQRHRLTDLLIAALLGGAAFALYATTLAPTILAGDGGEFQFVPYLLGVAHPTGYPLYTLLGWLWSHLLPAGDVAYRMNLFSAFWAALAVALLYPTTRSLLRQVLPSLTHSNRRLLGALAGITLAVTPTLWSQAIIAEVYGLHAFFVVLVFYFLLSWGERRLPRSLLLAAFVFGLSLAHHSTTLLLAPAILVYVWLIDRRLYRSPGLLLKVALLVFLPLLLYLLIPLRAPHTPYLRLPLIEGRDLVLYENTWSNFFHFVSGGPFGGSLDLSVNLGQRLGMSWGFLRAEMGWPGIILALAGLVQLVSGWPGRGSGSCRPARPRGSPNSSRSCRRAT